VRLKPHASREQSSALPFCIEPNFASITAPDDIWHAFLTMISGRVTGGFNGNHRKYGINFFEEDLLATDE
jgi:hypothetical protein